MKQNCMRKIGLKVLILFFVISLILILKPYKIFAASASISASSTTINVGESTTISVSIANTETWAISLSTTGGSLSNTSDADAYGEEKTTTAFSSSFSASSAGTYKVSYSGTVAGSDLVKTSVSGSVTITVVASSSSSSSSSSTSSSSSSSSSTTSSSSSSSSTSSTSSSAPTLTNLGITPYDFSGFKSYTTSYSVTVPNECSSVTIYATSASGNTITGTGTVTLSEGTNKYTVTVSNSNGSTTYTLSIIRETLDGDDVANSIEGEETEESEGIGLSELAIEGYELDPEFDISIYEYTVFVDSELTLEDLEEIKEIITAITNTDGVYTEITAEISEDGVATITIVVKDDEREYATYVIYFEQEESEVTSVVGYTTSTNSSDEWIDMEYFTKKVYLIMTCMGICVAIAMFYAISSYRKSAYIEKYIMGSDVTEDEEDDFDDLVKNFKENEILEDEEKSDNSAEDNKIPEMATVTNNDEKTLKNAEQTISELEDIKDTTEKEEDELKDSRAYKKPRRGFGSGGKH